MLFRNRYGYLVSRPWHPLSRRSHPKLVSLCQAYRWASKLDCQAAAYREAMGLVR